MTCRGPMVEDNPQTIGLVSEALEAPEQAYGS
jgi:hypothetical protein